MHNTYARAQPVIKKIVELSQCGVSHLRETVNALRRCRVSGTQLRGCPNPQYLKLPKGSGWARIEEWR